MSEKKDTFLMRIEAQIHSETYKAYIHAGIALTKKKTMSSSIFVTLCLIIDVLFAGTEIALLSAHSSTIEINRPFYYYIGFSNRYKSLRGLFIPLFEGCIVV